MRQQEPKSQLIMRGVVLFAAPILVYAISEVLFSGYRIHIAVALGVAAVVAACMKNTSEAARFIRTVVYVTFTLSLVFAYEEGYFSRFWFFLYLVPIYLGFLYTPKEAFAFLAGVMVAFIPSLGEVDVAFDIMSYVSLLLVIPLVIYLRDRYLVIRQSKKDIFIVEEGQSRIQDADIIARLLANKITNLGVEVRQALTFVKQASTALLQGEVAPDEQATYLQRMRKRSMETLEFIRKFEDGASANTVLKNGRQDTQVGRKVKKP